MQASLRIATFNIHKGFTHFNTHFSLANQRDLLRNIHADLVFLQEVQGEHRHHRQRFANWPQKGQLEFLADSIWHEFAYGKNSAYPAGHHGNALLSKYPIIQTRHQDISAHHIEQRGILHCEISIPNWDVPLHCICVHLGLLAHWRRQQLAHIAHYVEQYIPAQAPLIIAGDFNDWSARSGRLFAQRLHMQEVFQQHAGKHARSFPSFLPMLQLDRIYVRGFAVAQAEVHAGMSLIKASDHAILSATLSRK